VLAAIRFQHHARCPELSGRNFFDGTEEGDDVLDDDSMVCMPTLPFLFAGKRKTHQTGA
jgi:hypothetical protein